MLLPADAQGGDRHAGPSRYGRFVEEAARRYRPINVLLELTHRCHLDCVHCYLEDNHDFAAKSLELTTAEFCGFIDQLAEAGGLFLTFSGGEMFLRPDALAIARHARSKGLALRFYTSGTLMTPRQARELGALHPLSVEFSLYAAEEAALHDSITRMPGSHRKTLDAIRLLAAEGVPVVIKTPLMREIFDEYPKLIRLAQRLGVSYLFDPTVTPKNDADPTPCQLRVTPQQLAELYADLDLPTAPLIEALAQSLPLRQGGRPPDGEVCNLGKTSCAISPTGEVYPTLGFPWSAGNIRQSPFREIWHDSPLFQRLRNVKVKDLPMCAPCEKFSYCDRCCLWALMEDGDFFGPSAWACELAAAKEQAAGLPSAPTPYQRQRQEASAKPAADRLLPLKLLR